MLEAADRGSNTSSMATLIIITGMSGAGKTLAVQSLEDLGFFCVDNLPPVLIPKFAELIDQSKGKIGKVALVIDLRGREFFTALSESLNYIKDHFTIHCEILFLDATDSVLVQRYKESRRRHPLAPEGMPLDGIRLERKMLDELKNSATQVIDTSNMKPVRLKEKIISRFTHLESSTLSVNITSFDSSTAFQLTPTWCLMCAFAQSALCGASAAQYRPKQRCIRIRHEMAGDASFSDQTARYAAFLDPAVPQGRQESGDHRHWLYRR